MLVLIIIDRPVATKIFIPNCGDKLLNEIIFSILQYIINFHFHYCAPLKKRFISVKYNSLDHLCDVTVHVHMCHITAFSDKK